MNRLETNFRSAALSEISRAEKHLNEKTWMTRVTRALGLTGAAILAGIATLFLTSAGGWASTRPYQSGNGAECQRPLKEPAYLATFEMADSSAGKAERRRLVVAETEGRKLIAQIWSGNSCQATCRALSFEKGKASSPVALHLECQSAQLSSLTASATLLWGRGRSLSKVPTLRFGTWLQGYRQAVLEVELDRFSSPRGSLPRIGKRMADRSPAVAAR